MSDRTPDGPWTPQEAYCAFACAAIESDGSIGAEEQEALMSHLRRSTALEKHSEDLPHLVHTVHVRIKRLGEPDALAAAAAALPETLREDVFRTAVDLTWSADDAGPPERDFLHQAAALLGIPAPRRDALMDVPGASDVSTK